jgi:hypothetical protein
MIPGLAMRGRELCGIESKRSAVSELAEAVVNKAARLS